MPDDRANRKRRLILLRNHALLQVLYVTAGRASEVAQLTRGMVQDGEAVAVTITGKGDKERDLVFTEPAQHAIQRYLTARDKAREADRQSEETEAAPLFASHGRGRARPLSTNMIWRIVNEAAADVYCVDAHGHPKRRVGPHAFRHLRAQHLVDEGMPLHMVQALLGHADISTTRRIYAPQTPSAVLLDQVGTYGRSREEVARAGHRKLERKRSGRAKPDADEP